MTEIEMDLSLNQEMCNGNVSLSVVEVETTCIGESDITAFTTGLIFDSPKRAIVCGTSKGGVLVNPGANPGLNRNTFVLETKGSAVTALLLYPFQVQGSYDLVVGDMKGGIVVFHEGDHIIGRAKVSNSIVSLREHIKGNEKSIICMNSRGRITAYNTLLSCVKWSVDSLDSQWDAVGLPVSPLLHHNTILTREECDSILVSYPNFGIISEISNGRIVGRRQCGHAVVSMVSGKFVKSARLAHQTTEAENKMTSIDSQIILAGSDGTLQVHENGIVHDFLKLPFGIKFAEKIQILEGQREIDCLVIGCCSNYLYFLAESANDVEYTMNSFPVHGGGVDGGVGVITNDGALSVFQVRLK